MKPKSMSAVLIAATFLALGATLFSTGIAVHPAVAQVGTNNGTDLSIIGDLEENGVPSCGTVVTTDVELNSDLICDGTALTAGADGIEINLFGFTIAADTADSNGLDLSLDLTDDCGVKIPNHSDVTVVGPGLISGFDRGVCFEGADGGSVSDVILRDNEAAIIAFGSDGVSIEQVKIDNNDFAIIAQGSEDGEIIFNLVGQNTEQGLVLIESDGWSIAANSIIDNGENGIFVDAQSTNNIVDFNTVFGHSTADINNANGLPPNINDNTFGASNNCETSEPGGLCD